MPRLTRTTAALLLGVAASTATAQAPGRPRAAQPIASIGQPTRWEPYTFGSAVLARDADLAGQLAVGVYHSILNPVSGILGVTGEAYGAGTLERHASSGLRALANARALGLGMGVDWNVSAGSLNTIFSFQTAIRRGGLLGYGTMMRIDWIPSRGGTWDIGVHVPLGQPLAGRTRVRDTDTDVPVPHDGIPIVSVTRPTPSRPVELALGDVARAAEQILAYTNLFAGDTARVRYGESFTAAMHLYSSALARAFTLSAADSTLGDRIGRYARANLLQTVLIPYDSLFGQVRDWDFRALTSHAQSRFERWMRDSSGVTPATQTAVAGAHAYWLRNVERVQEGLVRDWRDSRLVWMPLQLALTPEQYDEQSEVDALIERVVGRPFTDRNDLTYLRSSDLPLEFARSIFATRDYHVLWTHDFTGRRDMTRELDDIGYTMVADAYLPALTQAIQRYDSTRVMPIYMILLDQFFYESRDGRLWMDILENPMYADIKLPGRNAQKETHLRQRQYELREAVRKSFLLQQDATANGGDRWLRNVVKVHVNIVNPADFSFRSHRIIPPIPFTPDNIMRDHRKIVFYDLNESNPYRGALILTGIGVGEHYASATWEDRGYRIRGPAALEARAAARRAMTRNGLREIPLPLRPVESARAVEQANDQRDYIGRALHVHNEAGFGAKESSVARAMLYNLAPPGSVMIVPDPLWVSDTWAAMLAGAAARGCRVYIIAPSWDNGPNTQPIVAGMEFQILSRLLDVRDRLRTKIHASGGELRIGLYTAKAQVTDAEGRRREIQEGLRRAPWISDVIPFDAKTLAVLNRATQRTEANGQDATSLAHDQKPRAPQLHQKTQLIARPGAIAALVGQPGWDDVLARAMEVQSQQTMSLADRIGALKPDADTAAARGGDRMFRGYEQSLSEADRKAFSFYFSMGTQNQDPRGIMQDGEATVVVSGLHAAEGLVDLYYIMARSTWVEQRAEMEKLLPPMRGLKARIARLIRAAL